MSLIKSTIITLPHLHGIGCIYLDSSINPELDPQKLPKYQTVQKADINELLDHLGHCLTSVKKYPQGKIPENERTKFLNNQVIGFFYSELKKLVDSLNPENLLEHLISYHEAIYKPIPSVKQL
ncbi:hypothetical protein [Dapis sp. BLCC M229]|uniref:hypothetical protein n=1 Tax=Dapis sp. BLCC M229 TaxID=3400188 RepID=UPI003CEC95E6